MTLHRMPTAPEFMEHAQALADSFGARLFQQPGLKPHEALALPHLKAALVSPILDETTYAVALHELGHLLSPTGSLRAVATGDVGNLKRAEEDAAWTWARHYALTWTPVMEALATYCEGTYAAAPPPPPPAPHVPSIKWNDWTTRAK